MQNLMPPIDTPDKIFHNGNPLTGEKGTIVTAEHLNNTQSAIRDAQSELIEVLKAAQVAPDPTKTGQLLAAFKLVFLSRSSPFSDIKADGVAAVLSALGNLGISSAVENLIINGGFNVNQRGYASGASLAAGAYGHDRWKAGTGGAAYTFGASPETISITSGSLIQVIEGVNNPGGSISVVWEGTAQCRINGGAFSASPLVINNLVAGANLTVEFNNGTLSRVQCSQGTVPFAYRRRHYPLELALCQRYFQYSSNGTVGTYSPNGGESHTYWFMKVVMRTAPTVTLNGGVGIPYKVTPDFVDVYQTTSDTTHYAVIKEISLSAEI